MATKRATGEQLNVRYDGPNDILAFEDWTWEKGGTATRNGDPALLPARKFRELVKLSRGTAWLEVVEGDPMADPTEEEAARAAAAAETTAEPAE